MLKKINQKWQHLKYLNKISPIVMVNRLVKKIIAPIYKHEIGYITLRDEFDIRKYNDNTETKCVVLKTPVSLEVWEKNISNLIPVNKLKKRLADGIGSFVIFATRPNSSGSGRKVVAYRKVQQGVFYDDRWRIRGKLSPDTLFTNNIEVLPEYRGQRINRMMMDAADNICRRNGINKVIGVIESYNQPSIKHTLKWKGSRIIGKIEIFSLFGGLYKRVTSWDEVKEVIENS